MSLEKSPRPLPSLQLLSATLQRLSIEHPTAGVRAHQLLEKLVGGPLTQRQGMYSGAIRTQRQQSSVWGPCVLGTRLHNKFDADWQVGACITGAEEQGADRSHVVRWSFRRASATEQSQSQPLIMMMEVLQHLQPQPRRQPPNPSPTT